MMSKATKTSTAARLNLLTASSARSALDTLDQTSQRISLELGDIGARMSRMNIALNVLAIAKDNESSASSRIMDVDVASESAELTRKNIAQQAAASVLAQANQLPQIALQLLRG